MTGLFGISRGRASRFEWSLNGERDGLMQLARQCPSIKKTTLGEAVVRECL